MRFAGRSELQNVISRAARCYLTIKCLDCRCKSVLDYVWRRTTVNLSVAQFIMTRFKIMNFFFFFTRKTARSCLLIPEIIIFNANAGAR